MKIKKLSQKTLNEANILIKKAFKDISPKDYDYPPKWFKASLAPEKNKDLFAIKNTTYVEYWIAIEKEEVAGIIGLYSLAEDERKTIWLGWFAVDQKFRGRKIGTKLLKFAIKKAREKNKKFLRLYTSDDPNEATAQILYDKFGFRIIKEEQLKKEKRIYKELKL